MKSYHLCLGILLLSVLVGAQSHINNDNQFGGGKKTRDREEMEDSQYEFVDDIEVGLINGRWDGVEGEKALKEEMLKMHNEFRRNVSEGKVPDQPGANRLRDLAWNKDLAKMAMNRSRNCQFGPPSRDEIGGIGQNIAYSQTVEKGFKTWTDESSRYNFQSNHCRFYCRNYKQLVSALTKYVGCAAKKCTKDRYLLVCNYGTGDILKRRPYMAKSR